MTQKRNPLLLAWRMSRVGWHLLSGCTQIAVYFGNSSAEQKQRRIQNWSAQLLNVCGMQVHVVGDIQAIPKDTGRFWVSNHVSWLDIFAINAVQPMRFVGKDDIQTWPVIGWLVARSDTIFISRNNRNAALAANDIIAKALREGANIAIFPEGTSTDGHQLKPFKHSLFQAPISAQVPIQTLCVRYPLPNGELNPAPAYHGDISLWQTLVSLLQQPQSQVEVHLLSAIQSEDMARQQLSALAQAQIAQCLNQHAAGAKEDAQSSAHTVS